MSILSKFLADGTATLIEDYSEKFIDVAPRQYPTASFGLIRTEKGAKLTEPYIRCGERSVLPFNTTIISAYAVGNETDLDLTSISGIRVGMRIYVPRTGEHMLCTAINTGTAHVTVVRGVADETGGAAAATIAGEVVQFLDTPMTEGWTTAPTAMMQTATDLTNDIEQFVWPISASGTMFRLIKNGGLQHKLKVQDIEDEAETNLKRELNMSLLMSKKGRKSVTLFGATSLQRKTGGIPQFAGTTHTADIDITDRDAFEAVIEDVCMYNKTGRLMVACSPTAFRKIQQSYQAYGPTNSTGEVVRIAGVQLKEIATPFGVSLFPYKDMTLLDYTVSGPATRGQMVLWDPSLVSWVPLAPIGVYQLEGNAGDNKNYYFMCEGGWRIKNQMAHMTLKGVTP